MHILVSLPLDASIQTDILLANIRKGLGTCGEDCDAIALPVLQSESIDCLFDAEERVREVQKIAQDAIKKYFVLYAAVHSAPVTETVVLGKTFDHYLKQFAWDTTRYPPSARIYTILSIMEQELSVVLETYTKKNKQYTEQIKKKEAAGKKESGSMYEADINKIAHRETEQVANSFFKRYYIGVREKMRECDIHKLTQIDGLFAETHTCIAKCTNGEIYEIMGRKDTEESIVREIESNGYYVKRPIETKEEYEKQQVAEQEIEHKCKEIECVMHTIVVRNAQKLYGLLMHANMLGLYIESILRFGAPATFAYFVLQYRYLPKVLNKWKKIAKTWKYSTRVTEVEERLSESSTEPLYGFVYRTVNDFDMIGEGEHER